jgi:hypothetical protein
LIVPAGADAEDAAAEDVEFSHLSDHR